MFVVCPFMACRAGELVKKNTQNTNLNGDQLNAVFACVIVNGNEKEHP